MGVTRTRLLPAALRRWLLISAAGAVVVAVAGHPATGLWWGWDDLHYLVTVLNYSPADYFFDAEFWKSSKTLFTPLNILPYELNYQLFGPEPYGFYLHQLLAAWLLFIATVLFLRLWCTVSWSVAGASLAGISAPVLITVYQIICVHYLEGLLFAVLAVYLYVQSLRKGKGYRVLAGAVFYFLACAAKEIYIPLVILLPFFPEKSLRLRLRHGTAYLAALAAYLLWRYSQLGDLASGYGVPVTLADVVQMPFLAVTSILGGGMQGIVGGLIYLLLLLRTLTAVGRQSLLFVAVLSVVLLAPLVPISYRLITVDRALVLAAWIVCVSLVVSLERLSRSGRRRAALSVLLLLVVGAGIVKMSLATRNRIIRDNHRYRTVGEHVMTAPESHALLLTGKRFRVGEARTLRRLTGGQVGPGLFYDPMQLAAMGTQYDTIHWFDQKADRLMDISGPDPAFMEQWRRRTEQRPLLLSMEKRDGVIDWEFGPYQGPYYAVVSLSAPFAFTDVYHVGRYPAPVPAMDFLLRYQSPEGWVTYSDVLHWDSVEGESLSWSRR